MAEPQTGGECIVWSFCPLGNGSGFSSTPKLLIIVNRQRHSVNSIFDKGRPISPSKHAGKGLYLSPELEKVTGGPDPASQTHRLVYASDIDCSRRKASGGVYVKSSSDCIISIIGITTRSSAHRIPVKPHVLSQPAVNGRRSCTITGNDSASGGWWLASRTQTHKQSALTKDQKAIANSRRVPRVPTTMRARLHLYDKSFHGFALCSLTSRRDS